MKKTKTIRLTVRDVAIFSMLDKLGLMNSEQVSKFLKISLAAAKKRLSSLWGSMRKPQIFLKLAEIH